MNQISFFWNFRFLHWVLFVIWRLLARETMLGWLDILINFINKHFAINGQKTFIKGLMGTSFISFVIKSLSLLLVFPAILTISCNKGSSDLVSQPQDIPVVKVIQMDVPIYREFVGQVFGLQDIPIRARVEGFLEGIHFQKEER